jgi:hypothetical protein
VPNKKKSVEKSADKLNNQQVKGAQKAICEFSGRGQQLQ